MLHRENTSFFQFNKGSGAHSFCILLLCTYNSIISGGEKCRGVGLLSCLLIKCKYYNLMLCLQLYRNCIMVVVITRVFNNVQTRVVTLTLRLQINIIHPHPLPLALGCDWWSPPPSLGHAPFGWLITVPPALFGKGDSSRPPPSWEGWLITAPLPLAPPPLVACYRLVRPLPLCIMTIYFKFSVIGLKTHHQMMNERHDAKCFFLLGCSKY